MSTLPRFEEEAMTPIFDALSIERGYQCQPCIDEGLPFRFFMCEECC